MNNFPNNPAIHNYTEWDDRVEEAGGLLYVGEEGKVTVYNSENKVVGVWISQENRGYVNDI